MRTYESVLQLVRDLSEHRLKADPGRKKIRGPMRCGAEMRGIIARHCRPKIVQMPGLCAPLALQETAPFEEPEVIKPRWARHFSTISANWATEGGH